MKITKVLSIAIAVQVIVLFSSCGGERKGLIGNEWTLTEIRHSDSLTAVFVPSGITLVFSDSSMVFGKGGCNSFFGSYRLKGRNEISIGELGSTMMWCTNMNFEDSYFRLIRGVDTYKLDGRYLELVAEENVYTLRYERN